MKSLGAGLVRNYLDKEGRIVTLSRYWGEDEIRITTYVWNTPETGHIQNLKPKDVLGIDEILKEFKRIYETWSKLILLETK